MIAAGLGLRTAQANDVGRSRPFGVYLGLRLTTTAMALVVIVVVALVGYRTAASVILVYALAKAAEATSEIVWGQLQQQEDMARIARSMVLKGVLATSAVAIALVVTHDLLVVVAGIALAWGLTLVGYDLVVARRFDQSLRPQFDVVALGELARTSLPLGIVLMIGSYAANVPRYLVDHYGGERELGVFSANANLMVIGVTLMTALGQAAAPRLARAYFERNRREVARLLRTLLAVALTLGLGGVAVAALAGRFALALLYTREFAERVDVLIVVMLAGLAANIAGAFGVMITASGEYRRQVGLQIANLVVALGVAWLLVPSYGALGAAWAACAASSVTAIAFGLLALARLRACTPVRNGPP